MNDETFVTGVVVERREHLPVANALVDLILTVRGKTSTVDETNTDETGAFRFATNDKEWARVIEGDEAAFAFFQVSFGRERERVIDTRDSPRWRPNGAGPQHVYVDLVSPLHLTGTVVDADDEPAADLIVLAQTLEPDGRGSVIGAASTDKTGRYAVEYTDEAFAPDAASADIEAVVYDTELRPLARSTALGGHPAERTADIQLPPPQDSLAALNSTLKEPLPGPLLDALAHLGLRTVSDLRAAGGVPKDVAKPHDSLMPEISKLNAVVALSIIDAPMPVLAALAESGVRSVTELAHLTDDELAERIGADRPQDAFALYRARASYAAYAMSNRVIQKRLDPGTPGDVSDEFPDLFRLTCDCDCASATSPQAYLAQLLQFTLRVVRYNGAPVDITFLQDRFRQPLRDLPATCDSAERTVAQPRLAIEVMRKHLTSLGLDASDSPRWYREAAYLELLQFLDVRYEELREVSTGTATDKAKFIERKGLGTFEPTDAQIFDELFRDIGAPLTSPSAPSEPWLESFFGLRSTLADPLDPDVVQPTALTVRRDSLLAQWVRLDTSAARPMRNIPLVDPDLVDDVDLVDRVSSPPNDDFELWRPIDFLQRRRREMQVAENLIDTGLSAAVPPAQRFKDLFVTLATTQSFIPGSIIAVPPFGFSAGGADLDYPRMKQLRDAADAGQDISTDLSTFAISEADLRAVVQHVELLEQNTPVTTDESSDVRSIILAHVKRVGFWPVWLTQESTNAFHGGQLALEPAKFRLRVVDTATPDPPWQPRPRVAEASERLAWEDILRTRTDAVDTLTSELAGLIVGLESRLLPQLRDELISTSAGGVYTKAAVDRLIDRYQLDFLAGGCQRTTRVTQAIDTVQGLLFGARNGLLDDAAWSTAAADFDATWRSLESYETWLAMMLAFLHPESLLRPSLLTRPSPGFAKALEQLRDADPIALADAAAVYGSYADYLNDVASLELLAAVACPIPPLPSSGPRSAVYLLGGTAGRGARRVYWSVAIEQQDNAGDQGWWHPIPDMDRADEISGSGMCGTYVVALTSSALATSRILELWRIPLPPADLSDADVLDYAPDWEGPFALDLPAGVTTFLSASISHGSATTAPIVTIDADESTTYSRPLDLGAKSWSGRFRSSRAQVLWRRLGQSDPYGVMPANGATFACDGNGLQKSVPEARFVVAADADGDGADELIAFGGADGFWSMKQIMVGPRATWLPLGTRPVNRRYDVTLATPANTLFFTVSGDFDGDGADEIAALTDATAPRGSIYTSWLDLFVKKWNVAAAAWHDLGTKTDPTTGAQLWQAIPWLDPRACVVGRFTQDQRDEVLLAYHDGRSGGNVTDLEIFGFADGTWKSIVRSSVSDFAGGQPLTGGAIRAARTVEGAAHQLLVEQIGSTGLASGRCWTLQFRTDRWLRLGDLDAGAISGAAKLIASDFDGDGVDEIACADDSPSIRFFKNAANGWSRVEAVTTPSPVIEWTVGDFENTGASYVIARCRDDTRAGVPAHIDQSAMAGMEQQPDLTLGSGQPARAVVAGRFSGPQQPAGISALGDGCTFYVQTKTQRAVTVSRPGTLRIKPYLSEAYRLARAGSAFALVDSAELAAASARAFDDNRDNRPRNRAYLDEAYYFLIVETALRLQSSGNFGAALDWLQLVARLAGTKLIPQSRFLALDATGTLPEVGPVRADPLDAHAVASRRAGTYGRFTRVTFARLLADYGDSEFAYASSPSLALARELYISGLALLDDLSSAMPFDSCAAAIDALLAEVAQMPSLARLVADLRALSAVDDVEQLNSIIAEVRAILASDETDNAKADAILAELAAAAPTADDEETFGDRVEREAATERVAFMSVLPGVSELINQNLVRVDAGQLLDGRNAPQAPTPLPQFSYCIPPATQYLELRKRIELALERLRNCQDIAGNELVVAPVGATGAASPANNGGAPRQSLQPLQYRYQTLVDRAKLLLEIARQLEATMLNYIDTAERKRYEAMNARRDLALASAAERLKAVQVEQAVQDLGSAALQRDRAQDQVDKWSQLLRGGLNDWEKVAVAAQWTSFGLKQSAAIATTIKYAASPEGWVSDVITYGAEPSASIATAQADAASALGQAAATQAEYDRRAESWAWNLRDSTRDVQIGNQQILSAKSRVQGAQIEQQISGLQASFASEVVTALTTKSFANEALYEWMAGVLEGTYRFFLQQATQLARMGETQLGFVLQQAPQGLIKRDYLTRMRQDSSPNVNSVSNSSDSLRGLTGAANLLRDLYQLDQLAFLKNQRKHQLTETVSLVRHDPLAFSQIATTGRIAFETPMELFDGRLPGHYLRLIHRMRLSVIALIPPNEGIHAVLSNAGVSRVVIPNGDVFQDVTVHRGYEELAFTSPVNATGVFELDAQPELLNTFEDSGVDTRWLLDLPRAANAIDYESLADILVTIEYTSLSSTSLRKKVIAELPDRRGGARVFSLRHEFPDLWYDLCNAAPAAHAFDTTIRVRRSDFPPNLEDLRVRGISLTVGFSDAASQLDVDYLRFAPTTTTLLDGGPAQTDTSGVVSTRRANGAGWLAIVGGAATVEPTGEWRLRFAATALQHFASQEIDDVLFAITFDGRPPPWP